MNSPPLDLSLTKELVRQPRVQVVVLCAESVHDTEQAPLETSEKSKERVLGAVDVLQNIEHPQALTT